MFCPNCGNHILDANASFCPNCGAQLNSFTQGNDQSSAQQDFQQDSQQNSQQNSQQSWYNQFNYTPPQQDCTPCAPSANYNGLSIAGFSLSCAAIIFNFFFYIFNTFHYYLPISNFLIREYPILQVGFIFLITLPLYPSLQDQIPLLFNLQK